MHRFWSSGVKVVESMKSNSLTDTRSHLFSAGVAITFPATDSAPDFEPSLLSSLFFTGLHHRTSVPGNERSTDFKVDYETALTLIAFEN